MKDIPSPHDPRLDAMLDQALAPEPADPALVQRIVAATQCRLGPREDEGPVLARLRPALMSLAAALLLALGLAVWLVQPVERDPVPTENGQITGVGARLDALAAADAAWATDIDHQLRLLALQVDVTGSETFWASPERSLDDALLNEQFDALLDDPMLTLF